MRKPTKKAKPRDPDAAAWILTNGTRVFLDLDALEKGELRHEDGTEQDQCDGCGADLLEVWTLMPFRDGRTGHHRSVECGTCRADFEICYGFAKRDDA